jgi:hypothetical protein
MIYVEHETRPTFEPPAPWARLETPRHVVFWIGHIYTDGLVSGRPTIERLARDLLDRPLKAIAAELHGVFGLFVFDKANTTWSAMVDNAGLYKLYRDDRAVCSSFLELVAMRSTSRTISRSHLVEYLAQGQIYGGATLIDGVFKIALDEIVELRGPSSVVIVKKSLPTTASYDERRFLAHMRNLLSSCANQKISIDITGGYDTRLLLVLLDSMGADYELAISGWPGAADVQIAQEIAKTLGRSLFVTWHRWTDLPRELLECFHRADGQLDPVHFHRDYRNAAARLDRGVEIVVHGGAGGHYKDYFFLHDFPWYGSRRIRFDRFYDWRITPVRWPKQLLTDEAWALLQEARDRTIARFEAYRATTNNESYDRAAFFVCDAESFGGHLCAYTNMGLKVAAPFLDYQNMLMCFAIPPWDRFMTRWHRRLITATNPKVAKIVTTENYTASTLPEDRVRNVIGYLGPQIRRVAKKIGQRMLGKSMFFKIGAPACDDPAFRPAVRATELFEDAVKRLEAIGVLRPNVRPDEVREHHVPAVLNAGLLLRWLEGGGPSRVDGRRAEPVKGE